MNLVSLCNDRSNQVTLIDPLLFIDSFSDSLADITIPSVSVNCNLMNFISLQHRNVNSFL